MWFRSAVLATTLLTLSLPAFARSGVSDARKWRGLLPSVRATTDCIARGIIANPTALSYAHQENWLEAVKSMPEECKSFGSRLIAEHDRLFGPGTGKAFVEGPYASDLPRALKERIKSEMERQAAQPPKAEEAPVPAAPAGGAQEPAPASPPPLQRDRMEEDALRFGIEVQNEAAPRKDVAVGEPPAGETAAASSAFGTAKITATRLPDADRLDRPARPSPDYSFAYLTALAAVGLFAAGRTRGWRISGLIGANR
jgi:hypothetical protein